MRKLLPGDRFNRLQKLKKARVVKIDPIIKKVNAQTAQVASEIAKRKLAMKGLV